MTGNFWKSLTELVKAITKLVNYFNKEIEKKLAEEEDDED